MRWSEYLRYLGGSKRCDGVREWVGWNGDGWIDCGSLDESLGRSVAIWGRAFGDTQGSFWHCILRRFEMVFVFLSVLYSWMASTELVVLDLASKLRWPGWPRMQRDTQSPATCGSPGERDATACRFCSTLLLPE
jgi:hypothetical protein